MPVDAQLLPLALQASGLLSRIDYRHKRVGRQRRQGSRQLSGIIIQHQHQSRLGRQRLQDLRGPLPHLFAERQVFTTTG